MKRHAYLLMAHNNWKQLEMLLSVLDDERNDIFLHIDLNSQNVEIEMLSKIVKHARLEIFQQIAICWGDDSIMRCELQLLKRALQREHSYYHLLSGADLPLKSQEEIHQFFEENEGKEFVHFACESLEPGSKIYNRIGLYHFFQGRSIFMRALDKFSCCLQSIVRIDRWKKQDKTLMFGANWFSITEELAKYIVSQEDWVYKTFAYTHCCDELYLQTLVYNSEFKNRLYSQAFDNNYCANQRYIRWNTTDGEVSHPDVLTMKDYEILKQSNRLFARKFNMDVDKDIIEKICGEIIKK